MEHNKESKNRSIQIFPISFYKGEKSIQFEDINNKLCWSNWISIDKTLRLLLIQKYKLLEQNKKRRSLGPRTS